MHRLTLLRFAAAFPALLGAGAIAGDIAIENPAALRKALAEAKPGTRLVLAEGTYPGGFHAANLHGEPGKPIIIAAADPQRPPVFTAAKTGLHLPGAAYVEIHDVAFRDLSDNGLNIDDGGKADAPARKITLSGLSFQGIGARGNEDAIKLSGVAEFRIVKCTIERWGTGGGSGIDLVGCHQGVIEGNTLRHQDAPNCTGVQCKGGTSDIQIRRNRFESAGGRAVNIGGSTGLQFFRPALKDGEEHAEARNIVVEGNTFTGGMAAMAFVGVDGAKVRFNTIERPERWAFRILQENHSPGFVPSRNGEFTDNVIIFDSAQWAGINIGGGTAPETFKFARNWWYCSDRPDRSTPKLPAEETEGTYGKDPSLAKGQAGADAFKGD